MRTRLGFGVALVLFGVAVTAGGFASAGTEPTTPDSSTTTSTTTTSTTTTTTSTTTTTTTAAPQLATVGPIGPVIASPVIGGAPSQRSPEQLQLTPTIPPPTTTTLPPPPPADVLPANSGTGRRVVYSKAVMRVWTVEADGTVSKTHLVSGRRTWNQPLPGTYNVFSRSAYTCNIKNPSLCWRYMVRFTKGPEGDNIGFHEIPINTITGSPVQSVWQLGQALSGGCVRQAPSDAVYMWNWAPVGTKVVVLG
jgi:lipoprotein-anchoring transpeptidase ErfK/SrfK